MGRITTADELRALYGPPMAVAERKVLRHLDGHCRRFVELSPFVLVASARPDGGTDVSPRGDGPGFVAVLDDGRLAIPDRPGNRRIDTMENLLARSGIGLLFVIPGIDETLRVDGAAEIVVEEALNARLSARGSPALAAIVATVETAFVHCGKALMRADLWGARNRVARDKVPTIGEILRDQIGEEVYPTAQGEILERYRRTL